MAALTLLPDATKLVTDFLRAQPEVTALVGQRVYSILPAERSYPLVVLGQVADVPMIDRMQAWWATRADLRCSAYALTANAARQLAETVRAALMQRAIGQHAVGTVAYVACLNLAYLPDDGVLTAQGRPIPRWTWLTTITVHPNPN